MFNLTLLLVALAATLSLVSAVPARQTVSRTTAAAIEDGVVVAQRNVTASESVEKRDGPGLYVCLDVGFGEPCKYIPNIVPAAGGGGCYKAEGAFANAISSIGPDKGLTCYGHLRNDCMSDKRANLGPITYPGIDTVRQFQSAGDFHDRVNSIVCYKD